MLTRLAIADFRPDSAGFDSEFTSVAQNVLPIEEGFGPFLGPSVASAALGSACRGAFQAVDSTGSRILFAGTGTGLFRYDTVAGSWTDVSGASAPYNLSDLGFWSFSQFGNYVRAINPYDPPQYYDLTSSTDFADNAGSPPDGMIGLTFKDFAFNIGGSSATSQQIAWSDYQDPDSWNVAGTLSDTQTLYDGGPITCAVAGEALFVFQRSRLHRLVFTGTAFVFQRDEIVSGRGCVGPFAACVSGGSAYYLADDGFYATSFNGETTPIGANRVNRWFRARISEDAIRSVIAIADPKHPRVYFAYQTGANSASVNFDEVLVYDWLLDRWAGPVAFDLQWLFSSTSVGVDLDTDLPGEDPSADAEDEPSLDSPLYDGGDPLLGTFDSLGRYCLLGGGALEAVFETAPLLGNTAVRKMVSGAFPIVSGGTTAVTVQIGTREVPGDSETWSAGVTPNAIGRCRLPRVSGRGLKARVTIAAGETWTKAFGIDLDVSELGVR